MAKLKNIAAAMPPAPSSAPAAHQPPGMPPPHNATIATRAPTAAPPAQPNYPPPVHADSGATQYIVTDATVRGNDGTGLFVFGGALTMTRTTIAQNDGGGIKIQDAELMVQNNFIVGNGEVGEIVYNGGESNKQSEFRGQPIRKIIRFAASLASQMS